MMKSFNVVGQEKPWYGSPYNECRIMARSKESALKKAKREYPDAVWIWIDGEIVYQNPKVMDIYVKANPGVRFFHP